MSIQENEKLSHQGAQESPIDHVIRRRAEDWRAAPLPQKHDALLQGHELARAKARLRSNRPSLSANEVDFIEASLGRSRGRAWLIGGLSVAMLLLIGAILTPMVYGEYARRVAFDCDLSAAAPGSSDRVPGVDLDRIMPDLAIPACERAIAADPENPHMMRNLGRAFEKAGRDTDADFWYRRAAERGLP